MNRDEARSLLDSIGLLRSRSDLDLLVFFARHPHSLLSSDTLASFLGYNVQQIAGSVEVLLAAGLLARRQTPAHAARLYVFKAGGRSGDWLPPLLRLASTREGRTALRRELARNRPAEPDGAQGRAAAARLGPRGLVAPPTTASEAAAAPRPEAGLGTGAEGQARTSGGRRTQG